MRLILIIASLIFSGSSWALDLEQLKVVTISVNEMCRGGSSKGSSSSFEVSAEGEVKTVLLKKLADLGVNGKVHFSENEWDGIKPILDGDAKAHANCVSQMTGLIINKLESESEKIQSTENELLSCKAKLKCDSDEHYALGLCLETVEEQADLHSFSTKKKNYWMKQCFSDFNEQISNCYDSSNTSRERSYCKSLLGVDK